MSPLTERDMAILRLVADGQANKDITATLGISVGLVMTPRLQAGACVWTPPQLGVPRQASRFGFSVRHIRGA
ncbi:LuxR C-terminal-related transcriptional regulator [Deinococcus sp. ME38]|uniref:LuxR C-terminal-related transcriptional regulator n=1 Tax=Deinococcus sp. ME38 TaxID=3400344 RepID=UPI003B5CE3E9